MVNFAVKRGVLLGDKSLINESVLTGGCVEDFLVTVIGHDEVGVWVVAQEPAINMVVKIHGEPGTEACVGEGIAVRGGTGDEEEVRDAVFVYGTGVWVPVGVIG